MRKYFIDKRLATLELPKKRAPQAGPNTVFQGVNLGGFLLLESWITPSLFANNSVPPDVGEWQFCQQLGPTVAAQVMNQHWNTWVQEVVMIRSLLVVVLSNYS